MDGASFPIVVVGVVVLGAIVALAGGLASRDPCDRMGRGGVGRDGRAGLGGADDREEEIRQMRGALGERRARREPPAGSGSLTPAPPDAAPASRAAPEGEQAAPDPALAQELRQLARARNARRRRQGLEPLDVEAEVARRLGEL